MDHKNRVGIATLLAAVLVALLIGGLPPLAAAQTAPPASEGSASLWPAAATGHRANLEWRTSSIGGAIGRRTAVLTFANQGELVKIGSSAVGIAQGDVLVYAASALGGTRGAPTLTGAPLFSCRDERMRTGLDLGRIRSRADELAGPKLGPGTAGYQPCLFRAPAQGLYGVVFVGPAGVDTDVDLAPNGSIDAPAVDVTQGASTAMWGVTVVAADGTTPLLGRSFGYVFALNTGANGRSIAIELTAATPDGFLVAMRTNGFDPYGTALWGSPLGLRYANGQPHYGDALAERPGDGDRDRLFAAQLKRLQGGITIDEPAYPLFFNTPDPAVLEYLGIPLVPVKPNITAATLTPTTVGGVFALNAATAGTYEVAILAAGADANADANRVLRGSHAAGAFAVDWDGRDNRGRLFGPGTYRWSVTTRGAEMHIVLADAENAPGGLFTLTRINGDGCPAAADCALVHFDHRGYRTPDGVLVGEREGGSLCRDDRGNEPSPLVSPPQGVDSRSPYGVYGVARGGNTNFPCSGKRGFGDTTAVHLWSFVASPPLVGQFTISPRATVGAPMVRVTKTDALGLDLNDDGVVGLGDQIRYTIAITNVGDAVARGVVFTDYVDPNTALVGGSVVTDRGTVVVGTSDGSPSFTVALGDMAPGAVATIRLDVVVTALVPFVENQGVATGTNVPRTPSDDPETTTPDDSTRTVIPVPPVDSSVPPTRFDAVKRDVLAVDRNGDGVLGAGDSLRYTITITNADAVDAVDAMFTDSPDANTTLVAGTVTTDRGTVLAGNSAHDTAVAVMVPVLRAGEAFTVAFVVTMHDDLASTVDEVVNQGVFTVPGETSTVVVTDDPDTSSKGDPTKTPTESSSTTAVTFAALTLHRNADGVAVQWTTALERDSYAFAVYRSASGLQADRTAVSPLILAQGRGGAGARYGFQDPDAPAGGVYWIKETEVDGTVHFYGPIREQWRVHLPLLDR